MADTAKNFDGSQQSSSIDVDHQRYSNHGPHDESRVPSLRLIGLVVQD